MSCFERNMTAHKSKAVATGVISDGMDKILGSSCPKPGVSAYNDAKDQFIYAPGGHLG